MSDSLVKLTRIKKGEIPLFIKLNQEAFQKGYEDYFGKTDDIIIPEADILKSIDEENAHSYFARIDGEVVGGVIVCVDGEVGNLGILYVKVGLESKGIGFAIWEQIEKMYDGVKIWKTCTPYFDQRNIHFYVNKCKFKVVEYLCKYHNPIEDEGFIGDAGEGMFEFEKHII